ncbi:MAG: hypothetical protein M3Z01_04735 [Thermoproteota archaeon]|nr:hypothetical protein [Thermoproteota archaeon]
MSPLSSQSRSTIDLLFSLVISVWISLVSNDVISILLVISQHIRSSTYSSIVYPSEVKAFIPIREVLINQESLSFYLSIGILPVIKKIQGLMK